MSALSHISLLLTGQVHTYPLSSDAQYTSAIDKQPCLKRITVTERGFEGDIQADQRVHGGVDKAIHHYAFDHYAYWQERLDAPQAHTVLKAAGAFGENISTTGITEADVCLCDRIKIGTCIVEVSQSRQPCWKLNHRFATPDMALYVQNTGKTGWYYRVLQGGYMEAGDAMTLLERPYPQWNLSKVNEIISGKLQDKDELQAFASLALTPSWKKLIDLRLESGRLEDMHKRLYGRVE